MKVNVFLIAHNVNGLCRNSISENKMSESGLRIIISTSNTSDLSLNRFSYKELYRNPFKVVKSI